MSEDPPYILDVEGLEDQEPDPADRTPHGRKWIGMHFECCGVYARVYRNRKRTAYQGNCPHCGRPVRIRISPGGTHHRMFRAW